MSNNAIKVENLGKSYILSHQRNENYTTLRDEVINKSKSLVSNAFNLFTKGDLNQNENYEEFWALKNINFEVKQGEKLGVIGVNGAGKSTILKLLSRITEPTIGSIKIKGRVASLLEVGTGFHPELTGRENIYLNGAILGMKRSEIKLKFDEIVDFAGTEKFLDTPVKKYSSGMYVRLAFAVAANLEPDILIVDEVLAVGDAKFQKKCLGKMNEITSNYGRTVIFVSHNMTAVKQLCNKAIHLHNGELLSYGDSAEIINSYLESSSSNFENEIFNNISRLPKCNFFNLLSIKLYQEGKAVQFFENSKEIQISIEYEVFVETSRLYVIFEIIDSEGNIVTETCHNSIEERPVTQPGRYISYATISKNSLAPLYHEMKFYFGSFGDTNYYPPIQFGINVVTDGESNMMYKTRPLGGKVILPISWNIIKIN